MPKITAYHPTLRVSGTNEAIKLGLDDWYDEDEILMKLGKLFPSAKTVGEVLEKIKSGLVPKQSVSGVIECEVGAPEGHCLVVKKEQSLK
jgi:hypothetical protein